jgi:hypothetical protein
VGLPRAYRGIGTHLEGAILRRFRGFLLVTLALALSGAVQVRAYSLLTHEQLIDLTWKDSIVPLLLSRYPGLTPAELEHARAYAYGGCVIQDIGYYPFGDEAFSNLTHYVRSGDFVANLFRNAKNADELAFAVGALSHYIGDSVGHAIATNLAVPVEFPKLLAKYGPVVNYAEGEHQHVQAEFAFDINEVAHNRMAPVHYLRHVGLEVPVEQLAIAFYQTYGLGEDFTGKRGRRINVHGYRLAVRVFIPRIAYAITILHRGKMPADQNTPDFLTIEKEAARVAAENDWQSYRRRAGIGTYTLAGLLFILPKIGPLRMVDIKGPTAATESDYMHSVVLATSTLRRLLARLTPPASIPTAAAGNATEAKHQSSALSSMLQNAGAHDPEVDLRITQDPRHPLPNRDLDTGRVVQPGGYSLTDSTYADLLHRLAQQPVQPIPPGIKQDILTYYADPNAPITTKRNPQHWAQVQADLAILAKMPTSEEAAPFPTYGSDTGVDQ